MVAIIKLVYFVIIIFMTMLGAVAALFLKRASTFKSLAELLRNLNFYVGAGLYLICAILNIYTLKYLDYSTVLPLTSMTYIWTMLLSYLVLNEKIGVRKLLGVVGIIFGALLIAV